MPDFFPFIPGSETSHAARTHLADTAPLLGRFRAVPRSAVQQQQQQQRRASRAANQLGLLSGDGRGSVHVGYGAAVLGRNESSGLLTRDNNERWGSSDDGEEDEPEDGQTKRWWRWRRTWRRLSRKTRCNIEDLWVNPRQAAVQRVIESWWTRWGVLVFLPAGLAVGWCALPFPQYPLESSHKSALFFSNIEPATTTNGPPNSHRVPGHGEARVQVNFWFFLLVYYGFYNLTALIWITKVFNLYSLNWWPSTLGFPLTISLIAFLSLLAPVPVYLFPATKWLTVHNTAWISWTFVTMALPVAIAFCILMTREQHLGRSYHSLSETQRIFTSSWWTAENCSADSLHRSARDYRRFNNNDRNTNKNNRRAAIDPDFAADVLQVDEREATGEGTRQQNGRQPLLSRRTAMAPVFRRRRRWLPASFVRFVWFCLALAISLLAYLIGESYAEIYLRTLPHGNFETVVYVYSWVVTVHLLDALTGWILGGSEGERVGSYPLSWIFKLYFMLTYQTYVRALYARLRSPAQFIWLQALSSGFLIILTPMTMTQFYHRVLSILGLTTQSYGSYLKICTRNVFIRFLAENTSMLTFLGSVVVLHFGPNKDVYPYFAFDLDDPAEPYDFNLTFYASMVTWACELFAGFVLRGLIRWCFGVNTNVEGRLDLAVWPELLPTSVVVILHVLQNMLFSIIRLQFR